MKIRTYIAVLLLTLLTPITLFSQESEEDLSQRALTLFEQEEYDEASKIYSTLLSMNLKSAEYNYRFGVCQLFTIQDKEEPIKYLKFATEQADPPGLSFYYYGLGLHLNYRFDKAIAQYNKYIPLASKKDEESTLVAHRIQQCQNGKKLVSSFTDISVLQRSVLPRSEFYRDYDLSSFGGKIIVKPEDFMSEEDKKRDAKFLMYFQDESDLIYYASYSDKNATGKDLFFIQKLPTSGWSEASKLPEIINTPFDEDYPFIHPEGSTLYFASKGHNSMGGYDIFKSERRGDGTWSEPVNMEFAVNTPWDDFMFITDLEETSAWFASNRETSNKQVTVYRIGMERIPLDLTLIKGVFEHDASRRVTITVEDMIQNKKVGIYESDRQLGDYLLDLRGSGKYKFLVEAEESDVIHSGIVEVPREKGLKQFRQEMRLVDVDGKEQLQIVNHFDEPIEDEQLLTADILKKQASLSVNASEEDIERSVTLIDEEDESVGLGNEAAPKQEKLALADRAVRTMREEAKSLNAKAATLYDVAQQKKGSSDPKEVAEATIAAELASTYRSEAERRDIAVEQMEGTLGVLKGSGLDETAFNAQYGQLAATKNNFKSIERFEEDVETTYEKRLDPTISAYESKRVEVETLEDDIAAIEEEITYYKQEIENTKDDLIKEELQTQIDEAQTTMPVKEAALDRATKEMAALVTQKDNALAYYETSQELLELADTYANENLVKVDVRSLNNLKADLTERAKSDPALLSFVAPKEAEIALEESLTESRKEDTGASATGAEDTQTEDQTAQVETASGSTTEEQVDDASISLNDQIKAIEASESEPDVVDGDYDAHFIDELEEAGNAEDPIIAESRKAELYDSWAENIGLRIDSLQAVKRQETNSKALVRIDDEIKELERERSEKEDLAMQSYQNIADLSDQAASTATSGQADQNNAAAQFESADAADTPIENVASTDEASQTETTAPLVQDEASVTEPASSDPIDLEDSEGLPPSVVAVNKAFTESIKALPPLSKTSSLEERAERTEIYNRWSDSLETELAFYGDLITTAESIEEKNDLESLAEEIADFRMKIEAKSAEIFQAMDQKQMAEETSAAKASLQQQLYEYVENYNASAFQQIDAQVANNPNPVIRAAQMETLHKNWMIALQNEKVKTQARIDNTNDPVQKEALTAKLMDLTIQKEEVQQVLDSLDPEMDVAGPSAPASVVVKGSERFEGYIPVENESVNTYTEKADQTESAEKEIASQVTNLEEQLADTKKKRKRREIQEELDTKERTLNIVEMESAFYEEASETLAAVETQVLTMEEGDPLPSERQEQIAESLKAEADQMTQNTRTAMTDAESVRKKKERLPAIADAKKMQNEAMVMQQKANLASQLAEEIQQIEQATIEQNHIILPGEEVVLPKVERTLNPNEKEDVRFTVEYLDYNDQKVIADSIRRDVAKLKQLEAQFNERGSDLLERSATAPANASNRNSRLALADQAYEDFERADSISTMIARMTREATFIENEANRQLLSRPEEAYRDVLAFYNNEPKEVAEVEDVTLPPVPEQIPLDGDDTVAQTEGDDQQNAQVDPLNQAEAFRLNAPTVQDNSRLQIEQDELTQTIFEIDEARNQSSYNDQNPIPVDPPLPSGLLYKVQIGAFRNPIKQDVFKGISPIMGETTPQGFIRYTAGEFNAFNQADAAKSRIQSIGYNDAFVVAFLDGERISMTQARAIEGGAPVATAQQGGNTGTTQSTTGSQGTQTPVQTQTQYIQRGPTEIQAVENIAGSFFTVQVGVYSKPVTSADVYGISPLMQENLQNGLYRYTTGRFDDRQTALRARDEARAMGVTDAFVTAYRDGVRVAVEQLDQGTATTTTATPAQQPQASGESFRILLGNYMGDVPVQQASQIILLSGEGVDKISNPDGSSSYYYGEFNSRSAAEQRAEELRAQGLTQAQAQKL